MSEPVYEYRILKDDVRFGDRFPREHASMRFRSDDAMWQKWEGTAPDPDDGQELDFRGLVGVRGLVEATAREAEADGAQNVRIERREVGPWDQVERRA
jgi:hypothetical protein